MNPATCVVEGIRGIFFPITLRTGSAFGTHTRPGATIFFNLVFSARAGDVLDMQTSTVGLLDSEESSEFDTIEELRLRTWARRNYAPPSERCDDWHPVILDEMSRKDGEL
jgi:hypothetical protein